MEYSPVSGNGKTPLIDRVFTFLKTLPSSDRMLLKGGILIVFVFALWTAVAFSLSSQVEVSSPGGVLREGVVGTPRFVNPILAVTQADRDMSALVYDGLMRLGSDGTLVPNIAKSIDVSDDGLTYSIVLRRDVTFHDGEPLTAEDVVFTVGKIQEPSITSPLRANFDGVTVDQTSEYELTFTLAEPYVPFIENLTFGILPQHIWKDASNEEFPFSQHNSEPIGSGPYQVTEIMRDTSGIPSRYVLKPHQGYHRKPAKISQLELHFFTNEGLMIKAFNEKRIDSMASVSQWQIDNIDFSSGTHVVNTIPLPRTFALFFNQNRSPVLRELSVRRALSVAVDRTALIESALGGYGRTLHSPIPPGFGIEIERASTTPKNRYEAARALLEDAGWTLNEKTGIYETEIDDTLTPLSFSISTVNNQVFERTATFLQNEWKKIGVDVTVKQFEQTDLTQAIIRPRDYEALLFGAVVGRSLDFYSFWHSSQRNDPGLNVALYANITTDSILNEARTSQDPDKRRSALTRFAEEIDTELPAIFLYSPEMLYIFPKAVTGASFTGLAMPHERFASITNWSLQTERIWPVFDE